MTNDGVVGVPRDIQHLRFGMGAAEQVTHFASTHAGEHHVGDEQMNRFGMPLRQLQG